MPSWYTTCEVCHGLAFYTTDDGVTRCEEEVCSPDPDKRVRRKGPRPRYLTDADLPWRKEKKPNAHR